MAVLNRHNRNVGISIVVPIAGRIEYCLKLFESFHCANMPKIPVEFILADNSINEAIANELKSLAQQYQVIYLHTAPGIVCARNEGAAYAKYQYLLYIDSDCTIDKNTLIEYANLINLSKPVCAAGKTIFVGEESVWWKGINDMVYFFPFRWSEWTDLELTWAPTCNLLIRSDIFKEVGGFQSISKPREASEDVDICLRIINAGYKISKCPTALVYHTTETWNSIKSIISHFYSFGAGQTEMLIRHGKYVRALPTVTGLFWTILFPLVFCLCLKLWDAAICLGLAIFINPIVFLLLQRIHSDSSVSMWNLFMHSVVEFFYETGKLFRSLSHGRYFLLRNHVFSFEMVLGLWKKNIDEFITYSICIIIVFLYLCLK